MQDEARTTMVETLGVVYGLVLEGKTSIEGVREALGVFYP